MAQVTIGNKQVDTDLRVWDAETRRSASLVVLAVAGVLLVGALLYFGLDATGSSWFLWTSIVLIALLLLFEAAVVATGIAREEGGPAWLAGSQAAQQAARGQPAAEQAPPSGTAAVAEEEHVHIDLKCPECREQFSVHDTGERPLHTQCPHCGAEGHVDLEAPPPQAAAAAEQEQAPGQGEGPAAPAEEPAEEVETETVSLKCPACDTQFGVEDDGTRPLEATCPGCGRGGKLK